MSARGPAHRFFAGIWDALMKGETCPTSLLFLAQADLFETLKDETQALYRLSPPPIDKPVSAMFYKTAKIYKLAEPGWKVLVAPLPSFKEFTMPLPANEAGQILPQPVVDPRYPNVLVGTKEEAANIKARIDQARQDPTAKPLGQGVGCAGAVPTPNWEWDAKTRQDTRRLIENRLQYLQQQRIDFLQSAQRVEQQIDRLRLLSDDLGL